MVNFKIPIKVDYMAIITGTLGVDNRFDKCSGSGSCRRKLAMNTAITQLDVFCVLGFQLVLVVTRTLYVQLTITCSTSESRLKIFIIKEMSKPEDFQQCKNRSFFSAMNIFLKTIQRAYV